MFPALAAGVVDTCMETWVSSGVAAGASGERGAGGGWPGKGTGFSSGHMSFSIMFLIVRFIMWNSSISKSCCFIKLPLCLDSCSFGMSLLSGQWW